jgi:hypothetical protein
MAESITPALARLERLIRLCREASYELDLAKNHIREPHLQAILADGAARHAAAGREFEERIIAGDRTRGDDAAATPAPRGSPAWAAMSAAVSRPDPGPIIEVCLEGERVLLAALEEAAGDEDLDSASRTLARDHAGEVAALRGSLQGVRDSAVFRGD